VMQLRRRGDGETTVRVIRSEGSRLYKCSRPLLCESTIGKYIGPNGPKKSPGMVTTAVVTVKNPGIKQRQKHLE
jgi:hypothetical protein